MMTCRGSRGVTPLILKVGTGWRCFVDRVFWWNGSIMANIIYSGYFYCNTCPTFRSRESRPFFWKLEVCFEDLPSSVTICFGDLPSSVTICFGDLPSSVTICFWDLPSSVTICFGDLPSSVTICFGDLPSSVTICFGDLPSSVTIFSPVESLRSSSHRTESPKQSFSSPLFLRTQLGAS